MNEPEPIFRLVEDEISGPNCTIYSLEDVNTGKTLLESFYEECSNSHPDETEIVIDRLESMALDTGARAQYFKHHEGKPGDQVCCLYDAEESHLRLFCIRMGTVLLVCGGGGVKSKDISAYQEDPELNKHAEIVKYVSEELKNRIKEKEIKWTSDGCALEGEEEAFVFSLN